MGGEGSQASQLALLMKQSHTEVPLLLSPQAWDLQRRVEQTHLQPEMECRKHTSLTSLSDVAGVPGDLDSPRYPLAQPELQGSPAATVTVPDPRGTS